MIAIVNVGPQTENPMGERNYEVRINREVIAKFRHCRGDGLAACLRAAADAVDRQKEVDVTAMLERLSSSR